MFACGSLPYTDYENTTVIEAVTRGYRLPRPKLCTPAVYELILSCWNGLPNNRPSFATLSSKLPHAKDQEPENFESVLSVLDSVLQAEEVHDYEYQDEATTSALEHTYEYEVEMKAPGLFRYFFKESYLLSFLQWQCLKEPLLP